MRTLHQYKAQGRPYDDQPLTVRVYQTTTTSVQPPVTF
jgi:hypothetical protein